MVEDLEKLAAAWKELKRVFLDEIFKTLHTLHLDKVLKGVVKWIKITK